MLATLSTGGGVSQQELAARMGVAPSLRIDDELTAEVDGADRLHDLLGILAAREGLP